MNLDEILRAIRAHMRNKHVQAYILTHNDAHASEYIAVCDERLAFVSNFTGSAGTALITLDKALLWTDGRYFTQAAQELPESWTLMKSGEKDVPTLENYLAKLANESVGETVENDSKKARQAFHVAVDAETTTMKSCERIQNASERLEIVLVHPSLADSVWEATGARPKRALGPVVVLPLEFTGKSIHAKIDFVVSQLVNTKSDALVISALDDIAWLLNARGSDIPFNPVFFAHAIVDAQGKVSVFTDHSLPQLEASIDVHSYDSFLVHSRHLYESSQKVWVDPNSTSLAFVWACGNKLHRTYKEALAAVKSKLQQANSCVRLEKPKKTPEEIEAMKRAQVSDGAAVSRFLAFLSTLDMESTDHDEYSLAEKLEEFRKAEDVDYAGNSFETISSFGENGAIVHYKPKKEGSKKIKGSNVFLCDSGGHYSFGGTTDTTRTVWLGKDKSSTLFADARKCYTCVLKGHVQLASAKFPSGIAAARLDSIARSDLWSAEMDFNHGTGHGVGCWLCVHELPPLISSTDIGLGGLVAGMCVTNEPGYYEEGKFGFRIENVMFAISSGSKFCEFDTITLVPYCRDLIDRDLLVDMEIRWINDYHAKCRQLLEPRLSSYPAHLSWLLKETEPL